MTTLLTIGVVLAVTAFVAWLAAALHQSGRDEYAAEEARREREIARKQAEVMAEMRSASDVANDLDAGRF